MSDETTTDTLAEIEGQAADYTLPEGWRVLQKGEVLEDEDWIIDTRDGNGCPTMKAGSRVGEHQVGEHQLYIRRIEVEPEPFITPDDVAAEPEPQPVQVREGRWRTRVGEIRHVTRTPDRHELRDEFPWWDASNRHTTWRNDGRYSHERESMFDLLEYLGPIEPEPEKIITPDDVAAEGLRRKLEATEAALLEQQQQNEELVTQGSQQRMQIAELRSEVSHVQRLLGGESRRVVELETLVKDLRNINATTEKSVEAAYRHNADLQHRLDTVAAEWAQQAEATRRLQIELDAREQVPQAVSDRFEEGWDKGTAQAVETIAEWTAPIRTCGSQALALAVLQNLPYIMRSLTGLADED